MSKVIKMQDLIKAQRDMLRKKHIWTEGPDDEKKPPQGGDGGGEETEKKLKINIPKSPFEPDIEEVTSNLKNILNMWKKKEYMSDEHRWKEYYRDILKFVKKLEGGNENEI